MNPLTVEWVDKAEGDFTTTLRELRGNLPTMMRRIFTINNVSSNI